MSNFVIAASSNFYPKPNDDLMDSLSDQLKRITLESIVTSFGLDFLVNDQHGGDVDTIHNVRQIDTDEKMHYKNKQNETTYALRGEYNSHQYHSDSRYIATNRAYSKQKKEGTLTDAYTGLKIKQNDKTNLDHVISAKEIHEDRGRVLSGLNGVDLANSKENLRITNESVNKSKNKYSVDEFLGKLEDKNLNEKIATLRSKSELTEKEQKELAKLERLNAVDEKKIKSADKNSRSSYNKQIGQAYYLSPQFKTDVIVAASNVGMRMGLRQALGFVFVEVWFSVEEEFKKIQKPFDFSKLLTSIGNGIQRGFDSARRKYKDLLAKFGECVVSGIFASVSTTLFNIFITTGKNAVKIIRRTYVSLVQAAEVLFINPDNYLFGDQMCAVMKLLATGASVAIGTLVSDAVEKSGIGLIPEVGEILPIFCGTFVTGIMTTALLYYFDKSETMNTLVSALNNLQTADLTVATYKQHALYFEQYAAKLMDIDLAEFQRETTLCCTLADQLVSAKNDQELNILLKKSITSLGGKLPWEGDFDSFMSNKKAVLIFE